MVSVVLFSVCVITVIFKANGLGEPSLNREANCLLLIIMLMPIGKDEGIYSPHSSW